MRFLLAPLLALCLISNASAQVSQEDVDASRVTAFNAVCRIDSPGGTGSGFVFAEDETTSYIMTCYHVVEETQAKVQFQRDGFMSGAVPVDTVYKSYDPGRRDLAILALDKSKLRITPEVLPLSKNVNWTTPTIHTIGHPEGGLHPTMFIGTVEAHTKDGLLFTPPPKGGRSGSPIIGYKESTGRHYAIGLIGWRNPETGQGRAMDVAQIYAILRGEDVALGEPIKKFKAVPVQYVQDCPDGKCYPFQGFFNPRQKVPGSNAEKVNPNNPWIKTPNSPLPVPGPPGVTIESRLVALENKVTKLEGTTEKILVTAEDVKAQLSKLGVSVDSKLKNYATRDALGNYVTVGQLKETSDTIVETTTNTINTNTDTRIKEVETSVDGRFTEVSAKNDKTAATLEKVGKVTAAIGPFVSMIPGYGTLAGLALTTVGGGALELARRKRKKTAEQDAANTQRENDKNHILSLMNDRLIKTKTEIEEKVAKPTIVQAEPIKTTLESTEPNMEAVLSLIRQEMAQMPCAAKEPEQFVAPVQHFQAQPPAQYDINYTVAPENKDALHFRQAMEAVSKKYPWTGNTISLIEKAYTVYKSGVK